MATTKKRDYSLANLQIERQAFDEYYPNYSVAEVNELRSREYSRLDELGHIYLDYTGGGLYSNQQLSQHMNMLRHGVFGNPHSSNPTSLASTQLDEHAREYVLKFFNASPDEYIVIFTLNASGALKLVGESYPFDEKCTYLLTFDNHNSVNGIREYARARGATFHYAPVLPPELRIDEDKLFAFLEDADPAGNNLFAYPAQSNFSGVQHSLEWIERAQERGWDVLLDAAAFAPTNRLDLSRWHPDFVTLSFYKIFGYPTGVGALIARKSAIEKLQRPWFAGGTITIASVQGDGYYLEEGEAAFEDGTINYLNLPAIEIGLKHIESLDIDSIHERVRCLTEWLIENLMDLHHRNGMPLIHLYGPANADMRGGTVTINFYDPDNRLHDYLLIEEAANEINISLRTGCFCNPGADESAHGLTEDDLKDCFTGEERMSFEQFLTVMSGKDIESLGAVRVSLGIASNFEDVYRFLNFAHRFLDQPAMMQA